MSAALLLELAKLWREESNHRTGDDCARMQDEAREMADRGSERMRAAHAADPDDLFGADDDDDDDDVMAPLRRNVSG